MKKSKKQMKATAKRAAKVPPEEEEREYRKCKYCRQSVLFVDGKPYRITSGSKLEQGYCPGRSEEFCKAIEP